MTQLAPNAVAECVPDVTARLPPSVHEQAVEGDLLLRCTLSPTPPPPAPPSSAPTAPSTADSNEAPGDATAGPTPEPEPTECFIRAHKDVLRLASKPLKEALALELLCTCGEGSVHELRVEGSSDSWLALMPLLYPSYPEPYKPLTWETVSAIIEVAHRYDMRRVLHACKDFMASAQLSCDPKSPAYVLTWLDMAERLQLDDLKASCIHHLASGTPLQRNWWCSSCGKTGTGANDAQCSCALRAAHLRCGKCKQANFASAACGCYTTERKALDKTKAAVLTDGSGLAKLSQETLIELLGAVGKAMMR